MSRRLFVVDGAAGLRRAISDVFGSRGMVQRVRGYRDLRHLVGVLDALAPPDGAVANVA